MKALIVTSLIAALSFGYTTQVLSRGADKANRLCAENGGWVYMDVHYLTIEVKCQNGLVGRFNRVK